MSNLNKSSSNAKYIPNKTQHDECKLDHKSLLDYRDMGKAICSLPITPNAALALTFFVSWYKKYGEINVSLDEIKEQTRLKSRSSVKQMLEELAQDGFLIIEGRKKKHSAKRAHAKTATRYHLTTLIRQIYEGTLVQTKVSSLSKKVRRVKKKAKKLILESLLGEKIEKLAYWDHLSTETKKAIFLLTGRTEREPKKKEPIEKIIEPPQVKESQKIIPQLKPRPIDSQEERDKMIISHNMDEVILKQSQREQHLFSDVMMDEVRSGRNMKSIIKKITNPDKFQKYMKYGSAGLAL